MEEAQIIEAAIQNLSEPHWLQILSWAATILLSGIAIGALVYTAKQVQKIEESNKQTATQGQASFLLELDRRWESKEMHEARTIFYELSSYIKNTADENYPHLTDDKKDEKVQELFSKNLFEMRKDRLVEYVVLMRLCGFLETMGYLIKKEYVSYEDINALFGGAILTFDHAFRMHINNRQSEKGVPPGLYEYALAVADMCRSA